MTAESTGGANRALVASYGKRLIYLLTGISGTMISPCNEKQTNLCQTHYLTWPNGPESPTWVLSRLPSSLFIAHFVLIDQQTMLFRNRQKIIIIMSGSQIKRLPYRRL